MLKDDIKTLQEHIYFKRQANAYYEIKASLPENDLMLHVDFAEKTEQDSIQSACACFGNR